MNDVWWRRGVVYEIYPRSFQDCNGDGVGDLEGILSRLDYLSWLGVDAVWITPFYPSPMADFGYDVSDYTGIDPLFGSLADFDRLVAALHDKGIRLIIDFVPNHTSNRHPWFLDSRSSRDSQKRDWYLWRDPAPDGGPPNNWVSIAGGRAWEFDAATGQYYCHLFLKEQPDLNWRHPKVRHAMYDAMRFWLRRGVDGFRIDVFWLMVKDELFRDDPLNPAYVEGQPDFRRVIPTYSADQEEVLDIAAEMRAVVEEFGDDNVLIGEIYLPVERLVRYYGKDHRGLHMPFNFNLMWQAWNPATVMAFIQSYEAVMPADGWPSWVLGNHDQKRIATRVGPAQAKVAMMLLLSLRGTPTLYAGDELGLENATIPPDRIQDPFGRAHPEQGRDAVRTPMPWTGDLHGGFSTVEPWLPVDAGHLEINVAAQQEDSSSMLNLTRRLLQLRRTEPALALGTFVPLPVNAEVLAYERRLKERRVYVFLNLDGAAKRLALPKNVAGTVVLATHPALEGATVQGTLDLGSNEGLIVLGDVPA